MHVRLNEYSFIECDDIGDFKDPITIVIDTHNRISYSYVMLKCHENISVKCINIESNFQCEYF